ncbi:MAG: ABC transporter permease [Bacillales bacterium]|nr:ABC transporter permease [Bacillales bacterium]
MKKGNLLKILFVKGSRSIKKNVLLFLSMFLMGALALTLYVGLSSNSISLSSRVDKAYLEGNYPSYFALVKEDDPYNEKKIKSLLEEGEYYEKRLFLPIKLNGRESYLGVVEPSFTLSKPTKLETPSSSSAFFYIDSSYKNNNFGFSAEVGDLVSFSIPISSYLSSYSSMLSKLDKYVLDGKENILNKQDLILGMGLTSFMEHPENISKAAYNPSLLLMDKSSFSSLIENQIKDNYSSEVSSSLIDLLSTFLSPNEYLFKLNKGRENIVKEQVEEIFGSTSSLAMSFLGHNNPLESSVYVELTQAKQLTYLFPALFFLVATLVMLTTLSQMIDKERLEIGTLKAIGLSNKEILGHYMSITSFILGLACLVGFIIGPLIIPSIMGQKYDILYTLPLRNMFVFPWVNAIGSALIMIGLGFFSTFYSCFKVIRETPSSCMRPIIRKEEKEGGHYLIKSSSPTILSLKMSLRSIKSNIFKSAMVVIGVAGCATLLLCGYGIDDTLNKGISTDLALNYTSSFTATYNESDSPLSLDDCSYVETYSNSYLSSSTISTKSRSEVYYVRLYEDSHPFYKVDLPSTGVAISIKTSKTLGVKVGDEINFTAFNKTYTSTVSSIFETFSLNGVSATFSSLGLTPRYNYCYIKSNEKIPLDEVEKQIKDNHKEISTIISTETAKENIEVTVSGIKLMTGAVKYFAIALALVVLYNLSLMNFTLKRRDIATLRVLGFSSFEIGETLMFESLILSLVGFFIGCLFGFPFMSAVLKVNEVSFVEFLKTIKFSSYVYSFILTFVVFAIVNFILALKSKKVKMVESLKAIE